MYTMKLWIKYIIIIAVIAAVVYNSNLVEKFTLEMPSSRPSILQYRPYLLRYPSYLSPYSDGRLPEKFDVWGDYVL